MTVALGALLLAYLPGLILFRMPVANRDRRAGLPPEERVFWYVVISLATTSILGLGLAAVNRYSWHNLLWASGLLSLLFVLGARGRLSFGRAAGRLGPTAIVPVLLAVLSLTAVFYVPPAEYIMGGKDPGTYMNEGIQIAQRGSLKVTDPVVVSATGSYFTSA